MMKKLKLGLPTYFIIISLLLCINRANGQNVSVYDIHQTNFDHIKWKDSVVHKVIAQMIRSEKDSSNVCVKECGYFVIYPPIPDINSVDTKKDSIPKYSYKVNIYYYEMEQMLDNNPIGYFSVKGRPVIILLGKNVPFQLQYSSEVLEKMSSIIKDYIPTKKDLKFKNEHDSTIIMEDFSESLVRLHGGKIINIYPDGRVEVSNASY